MADDRNGDRDRHAENPAEPERVSKRVRKAGHRHAAGKKQRDPRADGLDAERHDERGDAEHRDPGSIDEANHKRNRHGAEATGGDDQPDGIGNGRPSPRS